MDAYVDPLAVVGEVHLVEACLVGEVLYPHWVIPLQGPICVSQARASLTSDAPLVANGAGAQGTTHDKKEG